MRGEFTQEGECAFHTSECGFIAGQLSLNERASMLCLCEECAFRVRQVYTGGRTRLAGGLVLPLLFIQPSYFHIISLFFGYSHAKAFSWERAYFGDGVEKRGFFDWGEDDANGCARSVGIARGYN